MHSEENSILFSLFLIMSSGASACFHNGAVLLEDIINLHFGPSGVCALPLGVPVPVSCFKSEVPTECMNDRNAQVRPMSKESEKKELTGVCMIDQSTAYYILSHEIFAE